MTAELPHTATQASTEAAPSPEVARYSGQPHILGGRAVAGAQLVWMLSTADARGRLLLLLASSVVSLLVGAACAADEVIAPTPMPSGAVGANSPWLPWSCIATNPCATVLMKVRAAAGVGDELRAEVLLSGNVLKDGCWLPNSCVSGVRAACAGTVTAGVSGTGLAAGSAPVLATAADALLPCHSTGGCPCALAAAAAAAAAVGEPVLKCGPACSWVSSCSDSGCNTHAAAGLVASGCSVCTTPSTFSSTGPV